MKGGVNNNNNNYLFAEKIAITWRMVLHHAINKKRNKDNKDKQHRFTFSLFDDVTESLIGLIGVGVGKVDQ